MNGISEVEVFECETAGDHVEARESGLANQRGEIGINRRIKKRIRADTAVKVRKQTRRDVALLVEIEHEALAILLLANTSDQPASVRLPHSPFEVE